jgi:hypothetical protein
MKNDQDSQRILIKIHLEKGRSISDEDARKPEFLRCCRLASVINKLRNEGLQIETLMQPNTYNKGRHARYFIKDL